MRPIFVSKLSKTERTELVRILKTKPRESGLAWSSWGLRGRCAIAIKENIVKTISPEYMRRVIAEEGYSYKRSNAGLPHPTQNMRLKKPY